MAVRRFLRRAMETMETTSGAAAVGGITSSQDGNEDIYPTDLSTKKRRRDDDECAPSISPATPRPPANYMTTILPSPLPSARHSDDGSDLHYTGSPLILTPPDSLSPGSSYYYIRPPVVRLLVDPSPSSVSSQTLLPDPPGLPDTTTFPLPPTDSLQSGTGPLVAAQPRGKAVKKGGKGMPYIPSYMPPEAGPYLCVVCSAAATGHHYGVMACEGCKGFFRRSVQSEQRMNGCPYQPCQKGEQCEVTGNSRTGCQSCRYTKCIEVGMSSGSVLTPDERLAKLRKIEENRLKRRMASPTMDGHFQLMVMSGNESRLKLEITKGFNKYLTLPAPHRKDRQLHDVRSVYNCQQQFIEAYFSDVLNVFARHTVKFANCISSFTKLETPVRISLVTSAFFKLLVLRLASDYDHEQRCLPVGNNLAVTWPQNGLSAAGTLPLLGRSFDPFTELFDPVVQFSMELLGLGLDVTEKALLAATTLLEPEYGSICTRPVQKSDCDVMKTLVSYSYEKQQTQNIAEFMVTKTRVYCNLLSQLDRCAAMCRQQFASTVISDRLATFFSTNCSLPTGLLLTADGVGCNV